MSKSSQKIKQKDHVAIQKIARTTFDPRNDKKVKQRTPLIDHIPQEGNLVIWLDTDQQLLIFADKMYYQVFQLDTIKSFSVVNTPDTDGYGSSDFTIHFQKRNKTNTIFIGECHTFDDYVQDIESLTNLTVETDSL